MLRELLAEWKAVRGHGRRRHSGVVEAADGREATFVLALRRRHLTNESVTIARTVGGAAFASTTANAASARTVGGLHCGSSVPRGQNESERPTSLRLPPERIGRGSARKKPPGVQKRPKPRGWQAPKLTSCLAKLARGS